MSVEGYRTLVLGMKEVEENALDGFKREHRLLQESNAGQE